MQAIILNFRPAILRANRPDSLSLGERRSEVLILFVKRISKLLLYATCFFLLSNCKEENGERGILLLSYNVAGLPEGISSSHPKTYTSSISPLLNEFDIIHLQEDFCYHDSLLLYDKHPYRTETTGCVPNGDGLNTFSNFPVSDVARFPWNDCSGFDCLTPKGFYYSRITLADNVQVDFYNIHCNAGSSEEAFAARRKNIAQICDYIRQHSAGKAAIVMGDFNSRYTREEDTIRALLDMGFKDAWIELIRGGDVPAISPDRLSDCDSSRTNANCERVDKIFYRSDSTVTITALSYRVDDERFYYRGNDTLQLSDHWPLLSEFKFASK